ncbi:MAG: hypothetical protein HN368_10935, partial [Spirochaetales bacterium]|nr:hypothetical protein [Spirochaetales bacterium]
GLYQKTNTIVKNEKSGEEIVYSDLHIHLIQDHGFYQGKASMFRLDPGQIVRVLEMEPEDE